MNLRSAGSLYIFLLAFVRRSFAFLFRRLLGGSGRLRPLLRLLRRVHNCGPPACVATHDLTEKKKICGSSERCSADRSLELSQVLNISGNLKTCTGVVLLFLSMATFRLPVQFGLLNVGFILRAFVHRQHGLLIIIPQATSVEN